MLFNSLPFILGFLPATLAGFFVLGRFSRPLAALYVFLASLLFYGWWDWRYVPLLLLSILFNFWIGTRLSVLSKATDRGPARRWLAAGVAVDLLLLGYYKYAAFAIETVDRLAGLDFTVPSVVLPLGISFFTFTQIAYLADAYAGKARDYNPVHYGLFVTYFPHLIAGPILHHRQMMPQFADPAVYRFDAARLAEGGGVFLLGLAKKVVLADHFGELAAGGFAAAAAGEPVTLFAAWGAALAYTFQLYFDFSGYSDMAIGLGRMMGIELPRNFDSPYKATSIIDFWRRWHMTLSAFLRDYLYIPLGGNRRGPVRRHVNVFVTMVLGGLWHGAGWTFVLWGALHGALLVANHSGRALAQRLGRTRLLPAPAAWLLTFVCVVAGWVLFRAESLDAALILLRGMGGAFGAALPSQLLQFLPWLDGPVQGLGKVPHLADGTVMGAVDLGVMLAIGFVAVLALPNVLEQSRRQRLFWVTLSAAFVIQRVAFGRASEFLYFQF